MGKRLRVYVGPSVSTKTIHSVNDDANPVYIESPHCCANIVMRVRNFAGLTADGSPPIRDTPYFGTRKRNFSMQMQVRFKKPVNADTLVFGGAFDGPVSPPMGAWAALRVAQLIDPAITYDIYCSRPWIFSPVFCSMNIVDVRQAQYTWAELEEKFGCASAVDQIATEGEGVATASSLDSSTKGGNGNSGLSAARASKSSLGPAPTNGGRVSSDAASTSSRPASRRSGLAAVKDNGDATSRSSFSSVRSVKPPTCSPVLREVALQPKEVALKATKPSVQDILGEWEWGGEKELPEASQGLAADVAEGKKSGVFSGSNVAERRRWFQTPENRQACVLSPDKIYNMEIFAPFFDWNTFDVSLGLTFNVLPYINDQPLRIVLQSRDRATTYVGFEFKLVDADEETPSEESEEPAPAAVREDTVPAGPRAEDDDDSEEDEFFDA